eukprot:9458482-Lingulodinium_polyedra.AAC.1
MFLASNPSEKRLAHRILNFTGCRSSGRLARIPWGTRGTGGWARMSTVPTSTQPGACCQPGLC